MNGTFVRSLGAMLCIAAVAAAQGTSPIGADTCLNNVFGPRPQGGQANGANCSLTTSGFGQGAGPTEYWLPGGATVTTTHVAVGPAILLAGNAVTGFLTAPGLSIDLDIFTGPICIYDAIGTGIGAPCLLPVPVFSLTYGLPTGVTAKLISVQGFDLNPAAPLGVCATARNDIGVQDLATLGAPEMAPFTVAVVTPVPAPPNQPGHCANNPVAGTPVVGPTSATYPFPRDSICPNLAAVGTEISAYCANADATAPGATTATVNNIAVNILHVRPNEIIFTMVAAHEVEIGGPLVITSTGGTMAVAAGPPSDSADQPERWVWCVPQSASNILIEPANTGFGGGGAGGTSGNFQGLTGLVMGIGRKDGNNQVDYWKDEGLPQNAPIRGAMLQIDGIMYAAGKLQMRVQASGISPTVGPSLNYATTQAWSQCWPAVTQQCMNDTWFFHNSGDGTGTPGPVNTFPINAGQDDGSCGTNSQYGRSYFLGSDTATQPAIDPDGVELATGLDWHVCNDFGNFYPNPAVVVPYLYIILISR